MNLLRLSVALLMTLSVSGYACAYTVDVPVLRTNQAKGAIITAAMLDSKALDHLYLNSQIAQLPDELVGLELTRPYRAGMVIYTNAVRQPPLVHKNKAVEVSLQSGGLNLSLTGRALEDGLLGDTIRVQNTSSKQVIFAEVSAGGQVIVR